MGVVGGKRGFVYGFSIGRYADKQGLPLAGIFGVVRAVELALDVDPQAVWVDAHESPDLELEGVYT